MPRKAKAEAEKTRARIMASALALFAKKGYERTTFTDIAARLKMTKGAVYWHFASKERLLVALVDEMLAKFERQIAENMPRGGLTFPAVAAMMVENARRVTREARGREFFLLMKTQVRWGAASMARVREELLTKRTSSPYHAFCQAVANDQREGRVRAEVDGEEIASVCLAIWDGLVQSKIDGFLKQDVAETLHHAYEATWKAIAAG